MKTQIESRRRHTSLGRVGPGQAMRLGPRGGDLTVVEGRVWLTRAGELGDHLIVAGQRVRLGAGEAAVIESWDAGQSALLRWQPRDTGFVGALLAEPLRGVAFLAARLAAGLSAVARHAGERAARAQGRLPCGADTAAS